MICGSGDIKSIKQIVYVNHMQSVFIFGGNYETNKI
nr:MAG TPA: hypothetical protein [Caudoviricetes sp.]